MSRQSCRTSSICVPDADTSIDSRGKLHIVYQIQIRSGSYNKIISKKFSEFRLFDKIRVMYSSIDVKLPPKIWVGNKTDRVVADRKVGLTKYLNDLVVVDTLSASLSKFLAVPAVILDRVRDEIKLLGPCCETYGAGCYCLEMSENNSKSQGRRRGSHLILSSPQSSSAASSRAGSQHFDPAERRQLRCVRRFQAQIAGQLSLSVGEIARELKTANGWYYGCNAQGQEGYFPIEYVEKL